MELLRVVQRVRVPRSGSRRQDVQVGDLLGRAHDALVQRDVADDGIDKALLRTLETEERLDRRLSEVSVDQQDLLSGHGVGCCDVAYDGRLSLTHIRGVDGYDLDLGGKRIDYVVRDRPEPFRNRGIGIAQYEQRREFSLHQVDILDVRCPSEGRNILSDDALDRVLAADRVIRELEEQAEHDAESDTSDNGDGQDHDLPGADRRDRHDGAVDDVDVADDSGLDHLGLLKQLPEREQDLLVDLDVPLELEVLALHQRVVREVLVVYVDDAFDGLDVRIHANEVGDSLGICGVALSDDGHDRVEDVLLLGCERALEDVDPLGLDITRLDILVEDQLLAVGLVVLDQS